MTSDPEKNAKLIDKAIHGFLETLSKKKPCCFERYIYNEWSLQHELGNFLHEELKSSDLIVQFEKHIKNFHEPYKDKDFIKKEIDISISSQDKKRTSPPKLETIIELKFPRNKQVPETMWSFLKDIKFAEQCVLTVRPKPSPCSYALMLVNDDAFYKGNLKGPKIGVYKYFRGAPIDNKWGGSEDIGGNICYYNDNKDNNSENQKNPIPMEHKEEPYKIIWECLLENYKYTLIKIDPESYPS